MRVTTLLILCCACDRSAAPSEPGLAPPQLDAANAQRLMTERSAAITACIADAWQYKESLADFDVVITARVDDAGAPQAIVVARRDDYDASEFAECVAAVVAAVRFPPHAPGALSFVIHFDDYPKQN